MIVTLATSRLTSRSLASGSKLVVGPSSDTGLSASSLANGAAFAIVRRRALGWSTVIATQVSFSSNWTRSRNSWPATTSVVTEPRGISRCFQSATPSFQGSWYTSVLASSVQLTPRQSCNQICTRPSWSSSKSLIDDQRSTVTGPSSDRDVPLAGSVQYWYFSGFVSPRPLLVSLMVRPGSPSPSASNTGVLAGGGLSTRS